MSHLFSKINIGTISLENRIVMPPLASGKSTEEGFVTDSIISYYEERAKTGLGLIIIEHAFVSLEGQASFNQMGIHNDDTVEGLSKLRETIHKYNVACAIQINHAGSLSVYNSPVAPSAIQHPNGKVLPRELAIEEIPVVVDNFAQAALRAKKAGFDMVEIHGAHGYLLSQFLSPLTNKRTDEYGGSLENRMRLHIEVIKAVKALCGDFTFIVRLGCDDLIEGGLTLEESVKVAVRLEEEGAAIIDISGGIGGSGRDRFKEEGYFAYMSKELKKHLSIPVILTGGITTPQGAEKLIADNITDMVGIGRQILINANWADDARKEVI